MATGEEADACVSIFPAGWGSRLISGWSPRRCRTTLACRLTATGGRAPVGLRMPLFEPSRGTLYFPCLPGVTEKEVFGFKPEGLRFVN